MHIPQPIYIEIGKGLYKLVGMPSIGSWDTSLRPKNPKPGTLGFNTQTNSLEYWDGSDWLAAQMS
ncbi:hypothetical protein C4561_04365 [candidate division WWE3 bacterium]|uniref:Uncharacterized protein n=1 Tax=candidate division WWE3 bacterium TaxID=2053526 RepID=A0A3A4ZCN5_UNCKA|nr:MAG: hypothetical protein C4561_04365 [candidate division WWE3 bacterium]